MDRVSALYLAIGLAGSLPCWLFGRRRVQWFAWDYCAVILPYITWTLSAWFMDIPRGKTLSNMIEIPLLALIVAVLPITRVLVGDRLNEKWFSLGLLAISCLSGILMWKLFPGLPE